MLNSLCRGVFIVLFCLILIPPSFVTTSSAQVIGHVRGQTQSYSHYMIDTAWNNTW